MAMKYVAAYLMCVLGGNENPSTKEVKNVLGAVNADVEDEVLNNFIDSLKGKSCHELITDGLKKLQNIGGGVAATAQAGVAAVETADTKKEDKKEEKKEEEEEEEDDLGFSLFG